MQKPPDDKMEGISSTRMRAHTYAIDFLSRAPVCRFPGIRPSEPYSSSRRRDGIGGLTVRQAHGALSPVEGHAPRSPVPQSSPGYEPPDFEAMSALVGKASIFSMRSRC